MKLTQEEKGILAGSQGETMAKIMKTVVDFGNEDVVKRIKRFDSWGKSGEKLILNQNDFFDFDVCSNDLSILKTKIEEVLEKRNRK